MQILKIYNEGVLEASVLVPDSEVNKVVSSLKKAFALANSRGGRFQYEFD